MQNTEAKSTPVGKQDSISPKPREIRVIEPSFGRLIRHGLTLPHDENCGLIILLKGKPGTGKSTFALQLAAMLQTEAKKQYCTLEQTEDDLRFKLAFMLANLGVERSRLAKPDQGSTNGSFWCKPEEFLKCLAAWVPQCGFSDPLQEDIKKSLEQMRLPLYTEPKRDDLERCRQAMLALAELIKPKIKGALDVRIPQNPTSASAPFGDASSRVMQASRMLEELLPRASADSERAGRPIIVIDGLSLLSARERELVGFQKIVSLLRKSAQVGILVYEPAEQETVSLDHDADMVIELARRTIETPMAYLIHEIWIEKSRYQDAALGRHQFKIRASGLAFFPSLHFQVHHYNYMDLELRRSQPPSPAPALESETVPSWPAPAKDQPMGREAAPAETREVPPTASVQSANNAVGGGLVQSASDAPLSASVIDLIFCSDQEVGLRKGYSVVLLGSRGTFKTELCLDFLARGHWGCQHQQGGKGQPDEGLLISLIDNEDIHHGLRCPWSNNAPAFPHEACANCAASAQNEMTFARPFCQRPGCITPSEFFHYVHERVFDSNGDPLVKRVVFWDLTQMDYRFPLFRGDEMLLPALMDRFKTKGLKSLFMGAGNARSTPAASAMADNVLFCWRTKGLRDQPVTKPGLFLYVDRTAEGVRMTGKQLYFLELYMGRLVIPTNSAELRNRLVPQENWDTLLHRADLGEIVRISRMQGVQ